MGVADQLEVMSFFFFFFDILEKDQSLASKIKYDFFLSDHSEDLSGRVIGIEHLALDLMILLFERIRINK